MSPGHVSLQTVINLSHHSVSWSCLPAYITASPGHVSQPAACEEPMIQDLSLCVMGRRTLWKMVENGGHFYGEFGRENGKFHNFLTIAQVIEKIQDSKWQKMAKNGEHFYGESG